MIKLLTSQLMENLGASVLCVLDRRRCAPRVKLGHRVSSVVSSQTVNSTYLMIYNNQGDNYIDQVIFQYLKLGASKSRHAGGQPVDADINHRTAPDASYLVEIQQFVIGRLIRRDRIPATFYYKYILYSSVFATKSSWFLDK